MLKFMFCGAYDTKEYSKAFNEVAQGFGAEVYDFKQYKIKYMNNSKASFEDNSRSTVHASSLCIFVINEKHGQITWDVEYEEAFKNNIPVIILCNKKTYVAFHAATPAKKKINKVFSLIEKLESRQMTIISFDSAYFINILRNNVSQYLSRLLEISQKKNERLHIDEFGIQDIYRAKDMAKRNIDKGKSILESNTFYLIARSGSSFLGSVGSRHKQTLETMAKIKTATIKILLLNPYSYYAALTAFSYENERMYAQLIASEVVSDVAVAEFVNTKWFKIKLNDALVGYDNLKMMYSNIEVRFIDYPITGSVLLTDTQCYYEPYTNYVNDDRYNGRTSSFEIRVNNDDDIYKRQKETFHFLWNMGMPYEMWKQQAETNKNKLVDYIDFRYAKKAKQYIAAHSLIIEKDKVLLLKRSASNNYKPNVWDLPGGSVDNGERIELTLRREVKEETNLDIDITKLLYAHTNNDGLPYRQTVQIVYIASKKAGNILINPEEHSDYKWIAIKEIFSFDIMPYLREAIRCYESPQN